MKTHGKFFVNASWNADTDEGVIIAPLWYVNGIANTTYKILAIAAAKSIGDGLRKLMKKANPSKMVARLFMPKMDGI